MRLIALALIVLFATGLGAQEMPEIEVTVLRGTSQSDEVDTAYVRSKALGQMAELEAASGLAFRTPVSIVICMTLDTFDAYASRTGSSDYSDVLGLYIPPSMNQSTQPHASVAVNLGRFGLKSSGFSATLQHELLHSLMHDNIKPYLRPLWFEEGLAQYVSESAMEEVLGALGYISGAGTDPTSFGHLTHLLRNPNERGLAYSHALAAVQAMAGEFGSGRLWEFLRDLSETSASNRPDAFEDVFSRVFGRSFAVWERRFIESRTRMWYERIGVWTAANLFSVSMAIAAMLLVVGVVRRRRRDAGLLKRWREEDAFFPPDPSWAAAESPEADVDHIVAQTLEDAEREATPPTVKPVNKATSPPDNEFNKGRWTESGWVGDDD